MIKFFRKIREKLLSESKFSKYLIYAVGEIVLVVIGITLAVWINNLNLEAKQNKLKNTLIIELYDELQFNIDRLNHLDAGVRNASISGLPMKLADSLYNKRLSLLKNGIDSTEIEFICTIEEWRHNKYNLNSDVYLQLIETRTISQLPKLLQKEIKAYYKLIERESNYNDDYLNQILDAEKGLKYGFKVLRSEFLDEGSVNINNYTWLSDTKSKTFIDMEYSFEIYHQTVKHSRARMLKIIKESKGLQYLIEPIIKEIN